MSSTFVLKPRMSEKAYGTSLALSTYVFDVPTSANKVSIAAAVESQFSVKVVKVKTIIVKGKVKKSYQKRNRPVDGKRADSKKAYVRLAEGDTINIFGEPEAEKKETKKAAKAKKETK